MADTVPSGDPVVRTFLFTDVVHSAPLWEHAPDAMEYALARHDALVAEATALHDGLIVKHTGDGMFVVFHDPVAAVRSAVHAQQRLVAEQWPEAARLSVRMGLHLGTALPRAGDYFGSSPNRCNRIMSVAHGGQILVSEAVAGAVGRGLEADGFVLVPLGPVRLRGLTAPEHLHQVAGPGLPDTFDDPGPAALSLPPPVASPIIGREAEIAAVRGELSRPGLVTLVGPGGVGKTRIAIEVARLGVRPGSGHQIGYVDLVSAAAAVPTVAAALGVVSGEGETALDAVARTLGQEELLLVLDNCEHLVDQIARFADHLVAECPGVRLLATSQVQTGARTERAIAIEPLGIGDHDPGPAVRLFEARAKAVDPAFDLAAELDPVRDICRRLDGLPLAIELAAARARSLSTQVILERLDQRLQFLRSTAPEGVADRRATLEATIDWSYRLLEDHEQAMLVRLGCFHGPFDLQAVEAVVAFDPLEPWEALTLVDRLVARSLVQVDDTGPLRRFRLLESIAAFARDRLRAHPDSVIVWERHHEYFVGVMASIPDRPRAEDLDRVDLVAADVHPSVTALVERDPTEAAELLLRSHRIIRQLGWHEAALHWFRSLVDVDPFGSSAQTVELLKRLGQFSIEAGTDLAGGRAAIEQALDLALELGEQAAVVRLRLTLFRTLSLFPASLDVAAARMQLRELDPVKAELDDPRFSSMVDGVASLLCLYERRNDEGADRSVSARSSAAAAREPVLAANALALQGAHLAYAGRIDEGLELIEQAWAEADQLGDETTVSIATWLRGYASILLMDPADAEQWLGRELESGRADAVPVIRRSLMANLGVAWCLMGQFDAARAGALDALRINGTLFEPLLAFIEQTPDEADAATRRLLARLRVSGDRNEYTAVTCWAGRFAASRGATDAARPLLHEALELAVEYPACPYYEVPVRAELALMGDPGHLGRLDELVHQYPLRGLLARVWLARGVNEPDPAQADEYFDQALSVAGTYRLVWDRVDTLTRRSTFRRATGDHDGAEEDDQRIRELTAAAFPTPVTT